MSDPFKNLITEEYKNLFDCSIDTLISSFQRTCKVYYPSTKTIECTYCSQSNNNRGPNPFIGGGNGGHTGVCSVCQGDSRVQVENSEEIDLIVIFDDNKFYEMATSVSNPGGQAQTVCSINLIEKIKDCSYIIFDTSIENTKEHKFIRDGEPSPQGLGSNKYIITNWKRS